MLSLSDVIDLEERWKRWRRKKIIKFSALPFLAILVLFSTWYILTTKAQNKSVEKIDEKPIKEKNKSMSQSTNQNIVDDNISIEQNKPRLTLTIQPAPKSLQMTKILIPKNETIALEEDNLMPLSLQDSLGGEKSVENSSIQSDKREQMATNKNIQIKIEPSATNTTKYLKEKFDSTGNIVFALMVSEEYYHMKQYNDSIAWALTANELDPENERSWALFAQAKAKLGHQKEAIIALEEFLKSNNSGKIESLLIKLKQGKF